MYFFVAKTIYAHICCEKQFTHFFCCENDLRVFFVAKTIYSLHPESFCALKVAIRKVQTFWASGGEGCKCYLHTAKLNCQACSKLITLLKLLKWLLIVDLGQNYGMLRLRVWDAEFWPCRKMDTGRCTLINISHNPGKIFLTKEIRK